ncbi:MAG: hypothetical protein AAGF78_14005 [Pseudomonadota bacterium]
MKHTRLITPLLAKYEKAPQFPFTDWHEDGVSFYALMSLWDDLFCAAAGKERDTFQATQDVKMDIDSLIFDVSSETLGLRVTVYPESAGGTFHFLPSPPQDGFRSQLGFATDLEPSRLSAAVSLIQLYVSEKPGSEAELEDLDRRCVAEFSELFGFEDFDPFESRR